MTRGNAEALSLADRIGTLEPGTDADIVVLDARATPAMGLRMETVETLAEELFLLQTLGDDRAVREVYVAGRPAKSDVGGVALRPRLAVIADRPVRDKNRPTALARTHGLARGKTWQLPTTSLRIKEQEEALVFPAFDEATAFAIGSAIRDRALAENLPIVVDIRTCGTGRCSTPRCRARPRPTPTGRGARSMS